MNVKIALVAMSILLMPMASQALMVDIGFQRITNNNTENVANQLSAQLLDQASAFSDFGINLASDEVLFTFKNSAVIASNIAEIYFDDGVIFSQTGLYNSLGGYTSFSGGTPTPANLPSGNSINPGFVATASFGADVDPGNPGKGINAGNDILGIKIKLLAGLHSSQVVAALSDGDLRLGLHVRSIGNAGGSDSFVNTPVSPAATPVPLPAAAWLFGGALVTLLGTPRRRKSPASI